MKKKILYLVFAAGFTGLNACKHKPDDAPVTPTTEADSIPPATTGADPEKNVTQVTSSTDLDASEKTVSPEKPVQTKTTVTQIKADINGSGEIVKKGDAWVIRTSGDGGTDYLPENLGDTYKSEGMQVKFTAMLRPIPPGVRMAGKPISLITITAN